jgi:rhodanese-related sulfurtransferase
MYLVAICVAGLGVLIYLVVRWRQLRDRREVERYTVDAEGLHRELDSGADVLVVDVRQPLDLLAYSEIIPGATRIAPKEVMANPELIPRDRDAVVYCTCPSDATSLTIVRKALGLGFVRVRVLRGGLAGWKAKGFPVVAYEESFRLDTGGGD